MRETKKINNGRFNVFGLTLIELVITIGIIAVVSAGTMSLIGQGPKQTARDTRRRTDLESIASALAMYRNDNGQFPLTKEALVPNYITLPTDPLGGTRVYAYQGKRADGTTNCDAANRCVRYVICAAGEKDVTLKSGCGALSCGSTCSIIVSN